MKKFVFSLDPLFKVKKTMKDKLQAEYSAAEAALEEACRKREQIQATLTLEKTKFEIKAKNGMTASDIMTYYSFFEDLQNMEKTAANHVDYVQKQVNRKRAELISVFKEVKILEKLREKQYTEYIAEEEKEEKNVIEDVLSFNIVGEKQS